MPPMLMATTVLQRTGRTWLAKLRVAHMRREREKRRQREHKERLAANDTEVINALARAEDTAEVSRARRASTEERKDDRAAPQLRYMVEQKSQEQEEEDDDTITDWKEMRGVNGDMFWFSPSTQKTRKVSHPQLCGGGDAVALC